MTKRSINKSKLLQGLIVTTFLTSIFWLVPNAEARDGCQTGYHPNPYNPSQCVTNGTTGLETKCNPGQHRWYDPRTNQWNACK